MFHANCLSGAGDSGPGTTYSRDDGVGAYLISEARQLDGRLHKRRTRTKEPPPQVMVTYEPRVRDICASILTSRDLVVQAPGPGYQMKAT